MTIRTDKALREALRRRAVARRTSISELVRQILEEALILRQTGPRAARYLGALLRPSARRPSRAGRGRRPARRS